MKHSSIFLSIVILTVSVPTYAAEVIPEKGQPTVESKKEVDTGVLNKAADIAQDATEQVSKTLGATRERREQADYYVLGNYSPIDLLLPSKYGFTLGYIKSVDQSWELEYLRGSISVPFIVEDLGKMTDQRISLIGRSYFGGNSFNLSYGLSYFDFSMYLGDKLISGLTGGSYPAIDLVEIRSLGFNLAVGNRWTFNRNVTFGIDWISWAQPVYAISERSAFLDYATNQEDKKDVDTAMKVISYFPRLALLKLQLGILF